MKMFNPDSIDTTDKFAPLPDGQYLTQCAKVSFFRNKDGVIASDKNGTVTGHQTLSLDFVVLDGERRKSHIFTSQTIDPDRLALYPRAQVTLAGLLKTAQTGPVDLGCSETKWQELLVGKVFSLKIYTKDDNSGRPRTYINAVRTLTEAEKASGVLMMMTPSAVAAEDLSDLPF